MIKVRSVGNSHWGIVTKFELHIHYYILFQTNNLGKDVNLLIPSAMGWIVSLLLFGKDDFGIK